MAVTINIDIEATNRCNAVCNFCPRDATPHQGHMSMAVFEQTLLRMEELRSQNLERTKTEISLEPNICGLGEPLINPNTPEFIRRLRAAGFESCSMASNGALLDETRGAALLEAGLTRINLNISDIGEDYNDIYQLPFDVTYKNVSRFIEQAAGKCAVHVVLVNHRQDPEHTAALKAFWREQGVDGFMEYDVINRGGALFVDHMQYETFPERARARELMQRLGSPWVCPVPFLWIFVGYDGLYYLCCSDWKKEAPMASVFDTPMLAISEQKLHHVASREPVCKTCNHDPLNVITEAIRAVDAGECLPSKLNELAVTFSEESRNVVQQVQLVGEFVHQVRTQRLDVDKNRLIPVLSC